MKYLFACLALLIASPLAAHPAGEQPVTFEARSGESVDAFRGLVAVPENRADPASRAIELSYVRFPATTDTPGAPSEYTSTTTGAVCISDASKAGIAYGESAGIS